MHRDVVKFIEQMGLHWEEDGLSRIAGRIFGLALVSPEPCSLDDIAATLKVSKASVSNDARMLHRMGLIERVSFAGDRRDYYQITRDSIERGIETKLHRLRAFASLITAAADLPIKSEEVHRRLEAHEVAHREIIESLEHVIASLRKSPPAAKRKRVS